MDISAIGSLYFGKTVHTVVGNQYGLHFAPSAAIAKITRKIGKPVYFSRENDFYEKNIQGSIVGLTVMEFTKDDRVAIRVSDDYPDYALQAIVNCVRAWNKPEIDFAEKAFLRQYYEKNA